MTWYRVLTAVAIAAMAVSCKEDPHAGSYTITIICDGNGTGVASPATAEAGTLITLTATPDDGYMLLDWTVVSGRVDMAIESASSATFYMPAENVEIKARFTERKSLESALFHTGIEAWIVPRGDPYSLENFSKTRAATEAGTLAATHHALRIFPRNEAEQWKIEMMDDVRVAYIPFSYIGLTEEESQELETATQTSERPLFTDANPYSVTYDDPRTVESAIEEAVTQPMPILYAVWPVDKPLPDEMHYEFDYEVHIPADEVRTRSTEAVLSGEFWMWEVLRTVRIPVSGIKVRFSSGSNIIEATVDENGYFSAPAASIPAGASWEIVFQNPKWKVTRPNSTIPKYFIQGDVYQAIFWSSTNTHIRATLQPFDATIIKALNYFYYGSHSIKKWEYTDGLRVIANTEANQSYNGLFTYTGQNTCYINIYRNNASDNRNILMGTILHELGHFVHYMERGGTYQDFGIVDRLLQESFASYVGWYLTEKYYTDLGYVKSLGEDISGQARQLSWMSTTTSDWGYYSPLFVDLVDNFNQASYYGSKYNRDEIKGTPYAIIKRVSAESTNWTSCKSILREYTSLTSQDLDTFLAPYDSWYAR